jgi:phosphoglycerate dehydrogenase-like enzyme
MSPKRPNTLQVHFQSNPEAPPIFHITEARYRAAARRHRHIARFIRHSIATDREGFFQRMRKANVLVGWRFPRESLATIAPNLKWIHIIGAGIEHLLPLDWLPKGVPLVNNSGVHEPKMREYISMALMMLHTRVPTFVTQQRNAHWREYFSTLIGGKTMAILGVGQMGGAAAKEAKRLGLRVLGVRRHPRANRYVDEMFTSDQLHKVLPRADFVLVTVPLTPETSGWIDREAFALMRDGAGFINLGRARVVDYDALRANLKKGKLSGAILDVFDPEPLPKNSPLWSTPNLIITPHVASDDEEHYMPRTLDFFFDNVQRYLAGMPLRNRVQPARGY